MPSLSNVHPDVSSSASVTLGGTPSRRHSSLQSYANAGVADPPYAGGELVSHWCVQGTGDSRNAPQGRSARFVEGEGDFEKDLEMSQELFSLLKDGGFLDGCGRQRSVQQQILLRLGGWGTRQPLGLPPAREFVESLVEVPELSAASARRFLALLEILGPATLSHLSDACAAAYQRQRRHWGFICSPCSKLPSKVPRVLSGGGSFAVERRNECERYCGRKQFVCTDELRPGCTVPGKNSTTPLPGGPVNDTRLQSTSVNSSNAVFSITQPGGSYSRSAPTSFALPTTEAPGTNSECHQSSADCFQGASTEPGSSSATGQAATHPARPTTLVECYSSPDAVGQPAGERAAGTRLSKCPACSGSSSLLFHDAGVCEHPASPLRHSHVHLIASSFRHLPAVVALRFSGIVGVTPPSCSSSLVLASPSLRHRFLPSSSGSLNSTAVPASGAGASAAAPALLGHCPSCRSVWSSGWSVAVTRAPASSLVPAAAEDVPTKQQSPIRPSVSFHSSCEATANSVTTEQQRVYARRAISSDFVRALRVEVQREDSCFLSKDRGGGTAAEVASSAAALFSRKTFARRLQCLSRSSAAGLNRDGFCGGPPAATAEGASSLSDLSYSALSEGTEGRGVSCALPISLTDASHMTDAQNLAADLDGVSQRAGQQDGERAAAAGKSIKGEPLKKGPSLAANFLAAGAAAPREPLSATRRAHADCISLPLSPGRRLSSAGSGRSSSSPQRGAVQAGDVLSPWLSEKDSVWGSRRLVNGVDAGQRLSEHALRAFVVEWARGTEAASRACALLSRVGEEAAFLPLGRRKKSEYADFLERLLVDWITRVLDQSASAQSRSACAKADAMVKGCENTFAPLTEPGVSQNRGRHYGRDSATAAATATARLCGLCACLTGCLRLGALSTRTQGKFRPTFFSSLLSLCTLLTAEGQPKNLAGDFFTCLLVNSVEGNNASNHPTSHCVLASIAGAAPGPAPGSKQGNTSKWNLCPSRAPDTSELERSPARATIIPVPHLVEELRQTPVVRQQRQLLVLVLCELRDTVLLFLADCLSRTSALKVLSPQNDSQLVLEQLRGIFQHEMQLCLQGLTLGEQGMSDVLKRSSSTRNGSSGFGGLRLSPPQAPPVLLTEAGVGAAGAAQAASAAAVSFSWWWWLCGSLVRCFVAAQKLLLPPWKSGDGKRQSAGIEPATDSGVPKNLPASPEWLTRWQQVVVSLAREQQTQQWKASRRQWDRNRGRPGGESSPRAGTGSMLRNIDLRKRCLLIHFEGLALIGLGEAEVRSGVLRRAEDESPVARGTVATSHSASSDPESLSLSNAAVAFGRALLLSPDGSEQVASSHQLDSQEPMVSTGLQAISFRVDRGEGIRMGWRARCSECDKVAACGFLGVLQGLHVLLRQQKEKGSECFLAATKENRARSSNAMRREAKAAIGVTLRLLLEDALREGHCRVLSLLARCGAFSRLAELRSLLLTFLSLLHHQVVLLESFLFSAVCPLGSKYPRGCQQGSLPTFFPPSEDTSSPPLQLGSPSPSSCGSHPPSCAPAYPQVNSRRGWCLSLSSLVDLPELSGLLHSRLFTDLPGVLDVVALLLPCFLELSLRCEDSTPKHSATVDVLGESILVCRSVMTLFVRLVGVSCSAGWTVEGCSASHGESVELGRRLREPEGVAESTGNSAPGFPSANPGRANDCGQAENHGDALSGVCCPRSKHGEESVSRGGEKGQGKTAGESALEASCWLLREVRRRLVSVVVRYAFPGASNRIRKGNCCGRSMLRTELVTLFHRSLFLLLVSSLESPGFLNPACKPRRATLSTLSLSKPGFSRATRGCPSLKKESRGHAPSANLGSETKSLPGPLSCIPGCRHGDSLHCWSSGNTSGNNATAGPAAFSDQARLCSKAALGGSLVSNHPSRAPGEGPNVSPARGPPRNRHDENQDEVLKNGDRGSGAPRKPTLGHSASGIQPKNGRWGFRESWYRFVSFFRSEKTPCGFVSSASPPTRRTSLRIQHGKESSQKEGLKIVDRVQVFSAPVLTAAGFIVREQLLLLGNVLSLSTRDRCFVSCTSASSGLYGRRSCSERGCTRAFLDSQNAGLEPQEGGKVSWFAASQTRSRGTPHDGGSGCPQQQEELDRKKRETRRLEADTEVLQQARACRNAAAEIWLLVARERACVALAAAAATGVENRPVGRDAPPSSGLLSVSWPPGRSQRLLLLRRAKLLSGDEPLLQLAACLSPWQLTMEDCGEPRLTTGEGTETETNSIAAQQERLLPFSVLHSGESQPKQQAVALLQKTLHAMLPRTSRPLARHLHLSAIWAAVASQQLFQRRAEHFCSCTVQAFATVSLASARTTLLSPEKGCPSEQVPLLVNRNLKDDVSLLAVEERIAAAAMDKWLQRLERGSFYASTVVECKESRPGVLDGHAAGGEQSALIFASVMGAGQAYILLLKFLQQLALLLCSLASPRGLSDSDFRAGNTRLTSVAKQQEHVVFGLLQRVFHVCPAVLHSADSVRALVETLTVIGEALHVVSGFATSQALLPPSGPSGVDVSAAASSSLPLAAGGIAGGKGSSVFPQAAGGMGGPPPTTDKAMQVLVNAIDGNLRRWVERLAQLVWLAACTLGSSGGGSSLLAHLFSLLLAKVALGRRESSSPNLLVRWFLPPPTSTGMSVSEASTRPRSIRLSGAAVPDSGAGFGVERGREGEKSASAGLPVATCALRPGKDGRRTSCNPLADLASVSPGFRGGNGVVAVSDFCGDIRSTSPLLSALPLCACYRCSEQDGSSRTFWVSPADSLCLPVRLTLSAGRWEEPALSSTIDPDAAKGVPSPGQDSCVEGGQDSRRRQCIADDQPSTANGSGGAEFSRVSEQQASVAASCREDADRGTLFPRYRGKGALGPSEVTAPLPSGSASDPAGSAAIHARRVIPSEDAGGGTGECRGPYDRRQSSAVRLSVFEQEPSLFVIDVEQVSSLRETTLNAFWTQISDADEFPAVAEPGGCARSAWPSTERLKAPGDAQAATCPFSHRQRTLDFQTSPRPPYESQARDAVAFLLTHQSCILYQSNQRRRLAELFAECIVVQVFGAALGPKPTGREGATFGPSTPLRVFDLFRLCGHSRPAGAGVVLSQGQAPASSRLEHSRALRAAPAGDPRLGSGSPGVALSSSGDIVLVGGEARSHGSPETGDSKKTPAQAEAVEPITSNRNRREGPKQKEEDVGGILSSAAPLDWRVVSSKVVTLLNEFFPSGCFTNTPVPHVQSSTSLQEKANVCTPGRARCVAQENEMPVTESIQEEDLLSVCWDLLLSDLQSVNITVPSPVASSAAGSSCPGSVSATVGGIPPLGGQSRTLAAEESLDSHRVLAGGFLWDGLVQTVARRGAGACAFQTREQAQRVAGEITRVAAALRGMSCFERMPRQDGLPDGSAWYDRQVSEAWRQQRELISLLQHLMSTSAGSRSAPLEARALTRKTDDDSSYPLQGLRSGIGSLWTGPGKQPASETALAVSPHSAAGNDACHLALTAAEGEDSTAKGGRNAFVCLRDEERPGWRHAEISRNQSRLLQFHNQDQRAVTAAVRSTPAEGLLWLAASVWTAALAGLTVERPRPPASTAGLSKCSPEFSSRSLSSTVSATAGGAEPSSPHSDFCYGTVTRPHNSISVSVDPASADLQISAHSAPTSDDLLAAAYAALALLRAFTSTQLGQGAIGLALPAWLWFLIIPQSLRQVGFYFHPEGIPMCGATSLLTQSAWSFETIELGLERITDWVPAAWLTMCNSVLSSQLGLVADLETTAEHLTAGEPVTAVRDIPAADLDAPRSYNVSAYWGTLPTTAYPKGAYAHRCLPVLQEIHRETVVVSAFLSRFVHLGCPVLTSPSAALSVGSRPLLFSAVIAGRLHTGQAGASAAMTAVHAAVVAIASSRRGARAGVRESEGKAEGFSKLMQSIFCRPGFAASSLPDLYLLDSFSGKGLFLHEKGGSRSASAEKLFSTAAENGASGEEAFVASTVVTTWTHLLRRVASSCEAASGFFLVHVAGRSGRHRSWGGVLSELPVQSSTSGPSNSLAAVEVLFLLCLKGLQDPRASRVLASVGDAARGQTSTGVWSLPGGCAGPGSSAGLASCCQGAVGDLVFPPLMPSCLSPQHPHAFFLPPPGQAKGARCKGSSGRRKGGDLASSEWGDCSRERLERSGKRCSGAADAWLSGLKSKAADPAAGARTLLCLLEDGWLAAAGLFRSDLKDQGETLAAADLAASCCACMLCYWLRDRHSAVAWTLGSLISFLQRPPHELYVSTCNCPLHRMHPGLGLGARQPLRVWLTDGDEAATSTALADVSHPFAEGRELQQQVSPLNLTMSSRRPVAGGGGTPETYSNCNSDILFRGDGDRGVAVVTGTNSPFLSSAVASLGTRGGECRSKLNSGTGVLQFAEANGDSDRGHGSTNCSSASGTGGITVTQSAKGPGYGGCAPCRPGEGLTPLTATDVDAVSTHTRSYVSVGVCSLPVPVSDRRWEEQNEEGMTRARLLAASQSLLYLLGFCPDSAACMSYTFAGQSHERGEPCTGTLNEPWCDTSEHERESAPQAPASSLGSERGGRPHSSKAARKRRTRERREGSQGSGDWTGGGRGGSFQSGAISGLPRSFPVLLLRALLADEVERLAAWKRVRTAAPSQSGITRLITRGGPARAGLRGSDSRGKPRATEAHGARRGEASGARKDGELDEEEAATSSSGEDEQEQDGIEKASGQKRRPGRAFFPFARGQNICDKYASGDLAGENVARLAGDESFSSSRQKKVPGPLLSKLPIVGRFFKKTGRNVALSSAKRCSKRQSRSGTSSKKSNYEKRECRGRGGGRSMASLDALLSGADLPLIAAAAQRLQWSPEILRKSAYVRQLLGRRGRGSRLLTFLLQHPTSKRNSSESIWRLLVRFDGFMPTLVLPSPSSSSLSCFSAFLSIRRPTSLPVLPSVSWDIFIYSFRLPLASTLQFLAPQTAVSAAFVANHLVASSAADENYCSHHPPSAASPFFSPSAVGTGAALHASLGTGPLACSSKSALLAAGTFSTLLRTYAARALATYPPAIRGRLLLPQLLQLMRVDVGRLVEAVLLQEGSGAQDAQANTGLPEMLQLSTEGALGNADCFPRKCLSLQAALLEALPSDRRELLSRQYAFWNGLAELSGKRLGLYEFCANDNQLFENSGILAALKIENFASGAIRNVVHVDARERVDLEGITMPLDPSRSIERVLGDDATPLQSAAKVPYALTFETRSTAGTQASVAGAGGSQLRAASVRVTCIFKMFDDVRQDQLALQIIQVAASVFNRVGIDLWLRPYKVLSMRVASQATPGFAAPCNLDNFVPTEASPEPPAGTGAVGATVSSSSVLYEKKHSKGGHHRDYVFCREDKDPANRRAAQPGIGTSPVSSLSLKRGSRAPTTMQVPRAATTHSQATAASPPLLSLRGACCSAGLRSARVVDKGLAMERNEQKCEKGISRRTRAANEPGGIIELIPHTASRHQIGKKYNCSLPEFFACVFERGENSEGICGFTKTAVGQSATSTTNQLSALQRRILLRSTSNDADREEARQRGWQSASERGAFCPAQVVADGGTRGGDPSRGLSQGIRVTAVNAVGAGNIEASAEETAGTKNEPGRVVEERTSKAGGEPTNVADDPDSGYARATSPNNTEASGLQLRSGATTSFSQTGRASGDIVQGQGSLTRKRRLGYDVAVNNFIKSLAGYAVLSFILQVKDRHNGNLLISYESGRVIHIDFGFIFDISPGHDMHFEKAPFKLTKEMVQLMGGHNRTDAFRRFTDLCVQGYLALREQADLIIALVQTMLHSGLPCFKRQSLDNLKWRFQLQATPQQAAAFMAARVMDAYENFTTKAYDMVQHLQQGIDY